VLTRVIADDDLARNLGNAGYERVREHYLSVAALEHWAELLRLLVGVSDPPRVAAH
jgi:hypothetical protein